MFFADLHVHSKFSRATSGSADLEHLACWAGKKGLAVVATGDFTHPAWFAELRAKLTPAEPGLFRLQDDIQRDVARLAGTTAGAAATRFVLQVEISTIYKQGDRTRKVHHLLYAPDFPQAERLVQQLSKIGNLASDGRPILGLNSRDLLEITLASGAGCYLIPAHIWTPWFAVLGSKSGFDSVDECYGDLAPHVFALETGLSSDPAMNWRLSQLDRFTLVSNSDAHSPPKLGREACVFATDLDYFAMRRALETGEGYAGTVEFFPEEGKYHLDGHRNCGVCCEPSQTRTQRGLCPVCGKGLTVGVMHRVEELADRPAGHRPPRAAEFRSLIPLTEMLAEIRGVGEKSRQVEQAYEDLIRRVGSELFILQEASLDDLRAAGSPLIAEAIHRMRAGRVIRQAGYDGQYGVIRLFEPHELTRGTHVGLLFDLPELRRVGDAHQAASDSPGSANATDPPAALGNGREITAAIADLPLTSVTILADLDPDQRRAAEIVQGPLLIVAGPGTGKTRTLTHRIAHLIAAHGIAPEQCLAISFSRRATGEISERLLRLLPESGDRVPVLTFHALGLLILREHAARFPVSATFRVAAEEERQQLLVERLDISPRRAASLLSGISRYRRGGQPVAAGSEVESACRLYLPALRDHAWVDFDDLILLPAELLEADAELGAQYRRRWRWLSVDEYQDIDEGQYRLIRQLVAPAGNLCAIGDPDQSIYGFRGANPQMFLRFAADFPQAQTVHLTRNYRSSPTIVTAALQAIAPASLLADRVLQSLSARAERIVIHSCPTERAEAEFVVHTIERLIGGATFFSLDSGRVAAHEGESLGFNDFAVLYRTEAQAAVLAEALARSGIPFQQKSHGRLRDAPAVRAMLDWLAKCQQPGWLTDERSEAPAERREMSASGNGAHENQFPPELAAVPTLRADGSCSIAGPSGSDAVTPAPVAWLRQAAEAVAAQHAEAAEWLPQLLPLAARCGNDPVRLLRELELGLDVDLWDPRADRVSLLTLHAAKGLEFDVVFLVGCEDGLLPLRWSETDDSDTAEERRLFFVGMTRARQRLFLSHARQRLWRGQLRELAVSPFLREIEEGLLERVQRIVKPRVPASRDRQLPLF